MQNVREKMLVAEESIEYLAVAVGDVLPVMIENQPNSFPR